MKRKHAEVIHAWADGAEVQIKLDWHSHWEDALTPNFDERYEYRIKPAPKPDVVKVVDLLSPSDCTKRQPATISLTWDGETGALKDCKVIE